MRLTRRYARECPACHEGRLYLAAAADGVRCDRCTHTEALPQAERTYDFDFSEGDRRSRRGPRATAHRGHAYVAERGATRSS